MYEFIEIPEGFKVFWGMYEEKQDATKTQATESRKTTVSRPVPTPPASEWSFADLMMSA